jgi:hypothetical protein
MDLLWRDLYWAPFSFHNHWKPRENLEIYFKSVAELVQQDLILIEKFIYVYICMCIQLIITKVLRIHKRFQYADQGVLYSIRVEQLD